MNELAFEGAHLHAEQLGISAGLGEHNAFSEPRTWTAGEVVTASVMNLHVRDQFRAVRPVYGFTNYSVATNVTDTAATWLPIPIGTLTQSGGVTVSDYFGNYSMRTSVAGTYIAGCGMTHGRPVRIMFSNFAGTEIEVARHGKPADAGGVASATSVSMPVNLAANQGIYAQFYGESGVTISVQGWIWLVRVPSP